MPILTELPADPSVRDNRGREDPRPGEGMNPLDQFRHAALNGIGTPAVGRIVERIREALTGRISPLALQAAHLQVSRSIQGGELDDPALLSLAVDAALQEEILREWLGATNVAPQQRLYRDLLGMAQVVREEMRRSTIAATAEPFISFRAVSSEAAAASVVPLYGGSDSVTVTPMSGEPTSVPAPNAGGNESARAKRPASGNALPEDVEELWVEFKRDQTNETLRNRLVEIYLLLVKYNAERIWARLPEGVEIDDLISAGVFGLMDAIHAFDLSRGVKFETYCVPRIRGAMLDELRTMDWVPRLVRSKASRLKEAISELDTKLGRPPTSEELAKHLDISVKELEKMAAEANAVNLISLNKKWYETDSYKDVREIDILEDERAPDPTSSLQKMAFIQEILRGCNRTERLILILYYWEEMTMKEIGATLDLSESRVSQMHTVLIQQRLPQLILAHMGRGDYLDSLSKRMYHTPRENRFDEKGNGEQSLGKGNGDPKGKTHNVPRRTEADIHSPKSSEPPRRKPYVRWRPKNRSSSPFTSVLGRLGQVLPKQQG
ncbi:MAG: FliA/WhiG family RNA polymerase sigma factor [Candidatus Peribacteraceae bacterium]|nr:FliA/WhiG family RNA polymerase sigma factor [Candidatus Peribacteraceae bacterium]